MAALTHPVLTAAEFAALMERAGWRAPRAHRRRGDVAWWSAEREPEIGWGAIDTVPDPVVEVLSPSTWANDLGPKRRAYLEGGVRELWLVDPADRTATIITAAGERRLGDEEQVTSPLLPGLAIVVSDFFA